MQTLYGIIGYPLTQSFSQPYFRNKFATEHIANTDYLTFPIASIEDFTAVLQNNPNLQGLNVTIPYKEKVLQYVQQLDATVQACGATNCIKITNGVLTAYNTDVIGFQLSLTPLLQLHHTSALLLGTGGAAKAVAYVLQQLGIPFQYVSRNPNGASNTIAYTNLTEAIIKAHTLIINASPSGMTPNEDTCPTIPYEYITPQHLLYDLVYKPTETLFLQKGKAQGAMVKNGFEMLTLQAEAAWKIWTAQP